MTIPSPNEVCGRCLKNPLTCLSTIGIVSTITKSDVDKIMSRASLLCAGAHQVKPESGLCANKFNARSKNSLHCYLCIESTWDQLLAVFNQYI